MANRYFYQFLNMFEKGPVMLCMSVAIGASGAPTLDSTKSRGIKSITRNSAGDYSIVLEDRYQLCLATNWDIISSTGTDAALGMTITSDNTGAASQTIRVVFRVAAGTATDISNGATLRMQLFLRNSSSPV